MLHNYNSFINIFEGREDKIEKQRQKIHKFLKFEPIIDFVFDKVVDKETTKGLKYTIWFSNIISKYFVDHLISRCKSWNLNINIDIDLFTSDFFYTYLKTGIFNIKITDEDKAILKNRIENSFTWLDLGESVQTIVDWLKSPLREDEETDLSKYKTLDEAFDAAEEWHKNLKASGIIESESGTVLMRFEDGYYWIDLETRSDRDEADAMGHCGTTSNGDTLYSLRKKQSPHVTAAIGKGHIYQMKGRNNKKPIDKYHPYIIELLKYPNVSDNVEIVTEFDPLVEFDSEYDSSEDFQINDLVVSEIAEIAKANNELISNEGISVKYNLFKGGYLSIEDVIKGYSDLVVIDNKIHFLLDGWDSFDQSIFKQNRNYREWQKEILDGTTDFEYNNIEFDYNYTWDELNAKALQEIYNYCLNTDIEIFDDKDLKFKINNENTKLSSDDIVIGSPSGDEISLKTLLDKGEEYIDDVIYGCEDLYDLKMALNNAATYAKSDADSSEAYDAVTDAILNKIGKIIPKSDTETWWGDGKLHIDLNFDFINDIEKQSDTKRSSIIDTINHIEYANDSEDLLIECDPPYYGWDGTITSDNLSEHVINRISEI